MSASSADRWAVVDVGPEAVRLLVARIRARAMRERSSRAGHRDEALHRPVADVRHLDSRVRLIGGDEPIADARVPDQPTAEIVSTVLKFVRTAERAQAKPLLVASESIGRSPEAIALLARIEQETSQPVRMLTRARQTQLTLLAVRGWLEPIGMQLVIDMRGALTDVTLTAGYDITVTCGLPIGAAALTASLPGDPPTALEWGLGAVRIGTMLATLPSAVPFQAIATGDSAHTLAGFDVVRGEKTAAALTLADMDRLSDEVLRSSSRKVARRTGDDPRRVAVLGPAALILAAILQRFGLEQVTVAPQGVRDGIILAAAEQPEGWWLEEGPVPVEVAAG